MCTDIKTNNFALFFKHIAHFPLIAWCKNIRLVFYHIKMRTSAKKGHLSRFESLFALCSLINDLF